MNLQNRFRTMISLFLFSWMIPSCGAFEKGAWDPVPGEKKEKKEDKKEDEAEKEKEDQLILIESHSVQW